jgi:hypothetical protein
MMFVIKTKQKISYLPGTQSGLSTAEKVRLSTSFFTVSPGGNVPNVGRLSFGQ